MENAYYISMVIILLVLLVLPVLLLGFTKENNKTDDSTTRLVDKTSTASSVPASPAVSEKISTSKETAVVKTIYRFIPEVYLTGDKKWKCNCCDTENSKMTEYCELCGTCVRNRK